MNDPTVDDNLPRAGASPPPPPSVPPSPELAGLMAGGIASQQRARSPDLDAKALLAAERALAEGEHALAAARLHLHDEHTPAATTTSRRELALRVLVVVNIAAMVVVAMLPATRSAAPVEPPPAAPTTLDDAALRRFNEPFNNALVAADRGRFGEAVTILEQYLLDTPHLAASQQLNVLNMLSHYAGLASEWGKAQDFAQRAAAIGQSHSLPADLVAMAKAAVASGDQETLRRVWARFLLQQRQIPSWLYKHVAEAYLQLGDSYRQQADDGAERARVRELEAITTRLREAALQAEGRGK